MLDEADKFAEIARKNDSQKIDALKKEFKIDRDSNRNNEKPNAIDGIKKAETEPDVNLASESVSGSNDDSERKSKTEPKPVIVEKENTKDSVAKSKSNTNIDTKDEEGK